ncbi:type VI secretion system lipoprotein TssJ [Marinobacterium arenosum]|uniref:type VI secretion system lipoprotein TssJ n=1 Tax=Marinobacterium arenosum TaxID=2862496 RepID=UPI001C95B1F0|nr:type VI secretion system lipoprotein TssJ [Marinobacterium arenosum]MBY4677075.1 type VI secretion system lipoprotein TssJ [Marinobacterium arenosum]
MKRLILLSAALWLLLSGCSSQQTSPTMTYKLPITVQIDAEVNPYGDGESHPIVLRLYQLTENGAFQNAPFIDLFKKDRQLLGGSLVDVLYLEPQLPGQTQQMEFDIQQQTRYLAVLAEFADYGNASGKSLVQLGQDPQSEPMIISVSGLRVSIDREPAKPWWKIF